MKEKKGKIVAAILLMAICFSVAGCGSSETLSMDLDKIGVSVMYNQSMVGVGKEMTDNIRNIISFDNDDANKMRYLTNGLYADTFDVSDNVDIVRGVYYDSFLNLRGTDYARAAVAFAEFADTASAEAAKEVLNNNLNLKKNESGTCDLTYGEAISKKNVVCIIATQEVNMFLELKRVFMDNSYVR